MKVAHDLYYRIEISYLGLNYFGWQKQANLPTVQHELEKVLQNFFGLEKIWTLATSRTDAGVSALKMHVLVKIRGKTTIDEFPLEELQQKLPPYLKIHSMAQHQGEQIIQDVAKKEYLYFFSSGKDLPFFELPIVTHYPHPLDLDLMSKGAALFLGPNNFHNFRSPRKAGQDTVREIFECEISKADQWISGQLFGQVYMLRVQGNGFMRNMVRFMMGSLAILGEGQITLNDLAEAIQNEKDVNFPLAPAKGLFLHFTHFKQEVK